MVPSSVCADAPLPCARLPRRWAVVLRRVGARQRGRGATVEGARILAFVLTIPFGGCEPHVWGCYVLASAADVEPKRIKGQNLRNICAFYGFCAPCRR